MSGSSSKKDAPNSKRPFSSAAMDRFLAAAHKKLSSEAERIDQLFYSYAITPPWVIQPQGIDTLCSDLQIHHTDVRVLMLAWKMQAEKQGYFTLDEWRRALTALKADTIIKLKMALPELEREVRRSSNRADFYSYAFKYNLTEEKQKFIDTETVCALLNLVLRSEFLPQVDALVHYLKIQTDYRVINMDQWMGFYRFCNEINFPELDNYDSDQAWPLIVDDFVDWIRSHRG
ncbi:hypothetical protein ACP275_09G096300 [Erythranthe tilingii]